MGGDPCCESWQVLGERQEEVGPARWEGNVRRGVSNSDGSGTSTIWAVGQRWTGQDCVSRRSIHSEAWHKPMVGISGVSVVSPRIKEWKIHRGMDTYNTTWLNVKKENSQCNSGSQGSCINWDLVWNEEMGWLRGDCGVVQAGPWTWTLGSKKSGYF